MTLAIWGVLTLLIISTPPYARADGLTGVRLPGTLEFDMVVEDAHHQVFESSGPDGSGVAVLGFDGSLIQTIALKGASGLALSGGDLYVAASSAGEIDVVDTVTLSVVRAIPLDGWTQPGDLHLSPGLVWFFGQPPRPTTISLLASVRSDGTGAPRAASGPIGGTSPRFVDGAGGRGFIYMFDLAAHPYVLRFPIVGSNIGEQFGQDSSTLPGGYGGSADAAFVPGRNTILMATGRTKPPGDEPADAVTEVSTQSLAGVMTYPVPGLPRAVAATGARGGLLAATTWSG